MAVYYLFDAARPTELMFDTEKGIVLEQFEYYGPYRTQGQAELTQQALMKNPHITEKRLGVAGLHDWRILETEKEIGK